MDADSRKDLAPFKPGDKSRMCIPGNMGAIRLPLEDLVDNTVRVEFPSRIHATMLDLLRLEPACPNGGGIALSIGDYATSCEAKLLDKGGIFFERDYYAEADHLAKVYTEAVGYKGGISLNIHTALKKHQGQGSSSALMASTVVALNELFGRPISQYNMRDLIGENYVEASKNGKDELCFGATTGVGVAAGFYGGICVISSKNEILDIVQPPENYAVMTFFPKLSSQRRDHPTRKEDEVAEDNISFLEEEVKAEQKLSEARCKMVLMDFIPAMRKNDFKAMGKVMGELNQSFLLPHIVKPLYPDSVGELSEILQRLGSFEDVDMCGMSSMGPTMYATGYVPALQKAAAALSAKNQILLSSLKINSFSRGLRIFNGNRESCLNYNRFSEP